jgi:hypothetical protein
MSTSSESKLSKPFKLITNIFGTASIVSSSRRFAERFNLSEVCLDIAMHGSLPIIPSSELVQGKQSCKRIKKKLPIIPTLDGSIKYLNFTEMPIVSPGTCAYIGTNEFKYVAQSCVHRLHGYTEMNSDIFLRIADDAITSRNIIAISKDTCERIQGHHAATDAVKCPKIIKDPDNINHRYYDKFFTLDRYNPNDISKGIYLLRPFKYDFEYPIIDSTGKTNYLIKSVTITAGTNLLTNYHFLVECGVILWSVSSSQLYTPDAIIPEEFNEYEIKLSKIIDFFSKYNASGVHVLEFSCQSFDSSARLSRSATGSLGTCDSDEEDEGKYEQEKEEDEQEKEEGETEISGGKIKLPIMSSSDSEEDDPTLLVLPEDAPPPILEKGGSIHRRIFTRSRKGRKDNRSRKGRKGGKGGKSEKGRKGRKSRKHK